MTEVTVTYISIILLAYLFGSLSTAIIVCKLMKLPDPRSLGSKNPGATNVLRVAGKKAAAITLGGDALKGVIPVLIAMRLEVSVNVLAFVAFAAFIGHLYPVFFQFKGGKGVATAFGVLISISWPTGLCLLATWLLFAKVFKVSSLAALISACVSPVYIWVWETQPAFVLLSVLLSILLVWRHRSNIRNLMSGSEGKI